MQFPEPYGPEAQTSQSSSISTSIQVLVIDDHEDGLEIITIALELIGIIPIIARDGTSGLATALNALPDLILMDISLPDMSGFELLQQLRQRSATRQIPVIAVTAMALVEERERIRAAGFTDYLSKPFLLEDLYAKVNQYLEKP